MRTSADEVSIHAVSPESTFVASSACASEASASTAASASDERTHQYPAAKDRCLLSIVPPVRCKETVEQWWCHDLRQGVNREPPGASAAGKRSAARFPGAACFSCSTGRGAAPAPSRRKLPQRPERDEGGRDGCLAQPRAGADSAGDRRAGAAAD